VALGSADLTDDDRLPEAPVQEGCLAKFCAALCSADRPRGVPDNAVLLPPAEQRELLARFQGARARAVFASSCTATFLMSPTTAGRTPAADCSRNAMTVKAISPPSAAHRRAQARGRSSR